MNKALIVVDVQRDFCEGGALAAADTPSLIPSLQEFIAEARGKGLLIVFTQDWHPHNHSSFQQNGGPWPVHCVANSPGAELMQALIPEPEDTVLHKGQARDAPGYSAFESTELAEQLRARGVKAVGICGIATEFCVRATALDAASAKFRTAVLTDLIRPVQLIATAGILQELGNAGIELTESPTWLRQVTVN
jgi:nicotinamidase/pyrazinamidase